MLLLLDRRYFRSPDADLKVSATTEVPDLSPAPHTIANLNRRAGKIPRVIKLRRVRLRQQPPTGSRRSFDRQQSRDGDAVEVQSISDPRHALSIGFGAAEDCQQTVAGKRKRLGQDICAIDGGANRERSSVTVALRDASYARGKCPCEQLSRCIIGVCAAAGKPSH